MHGHGRGAEAAADEPDGQGHKDEEGDSGCHASSYTGLRSFAERPGRA